MIEMQDIVNSIKSDLDHDKIMMEQIKEEIRQLESKLKYYQGKFDGRNEALGIIKGAQATCKSNPTATGKPA